MPMAKKQQQQIVERPQAEAAVFDPTAILAEEAGNNDIRAEYCAIPYLAIAESQSDVLKPVNEKYIEGLRPGQIYNTVTKEHFDDITVIPCQIKHSFVKWPPTPRGNPMGEFAPNSEEVQNGRWVNNAQGRKQFQAEDGNLLIETYTYIVVYITPDGQIGQAILPMAKTRLATAKQWNTQMKTLMALDANNNRVNPAKYMTRYKLGTVTKSGNGNEWFVYTINYIGLVDNPQVFEAAKMLADVVINTSEVGTSEEPDSIV